MKAHTFTRRLAYGLGALLLTVPGMAAAQQEEAAAEQSRPEYQALLEEAERARVEAEQARQEAMKAAEQAREMARREARRERDEASQEQRQASREEQEEVARAREELSRAHRELREASREIAEAHRQLARTSQEYQVVRQMNLGERAVIGLVLGRESADGVEIIGVSPGGPAERAGLQAGDRVVAIGDERLDGSDIGGQGKGRETLFRVMDEVEAGDTVRVEVIREAQALEFDITAEQREPSSWQTMIRIPGPPAAPADPDSPPVIVERIEIPHIDEEAIHARIEALEDELESKRFLFVSPDGKEIEITEEFVMPDDFDVEIAEFSELAGHALREANVWFGLPAAQGLELAAINEGLGSYFKTERGVLVLKARPDNAYHLESGDVVLEIDARAVDSPTDMLRALREIEPGSEIEIAIKRDRKNKTLSVVMPENRLGYSWPVQPRIAPGH